MAAGLLDLAEAQARLLALAPELAREKREISEAQGFFLAGDLSARVSRPEAATSAMDGFAVRHAEGTGPWRIVGESAAGHPHGAPLAPGTAVRIATGALLPPDADTVVIQEDCIRERERLELGAALPPAGANVRRAGTDFGAGDLLLEKGAWLGPAALALALAAGHTHVTVRRPPNIAVVDGGDELVPPGAPRQRGQVAASNAPMLAAMLADLPCTVRRVGPIADRLAELTEALEACREADLVVTTGGASVGDHDLVRPALAAVGAELAFWKIAIKPGKPLLVAHRERGGSGRQLILGLPGNPASAFVTGFLFLLPLVRATLGAAEPLPRPICARLAAPVAATGARAEFLRARWDGDKVEGLVLQDSGALRPLAAANALIARPPGAEALATGEQVPVYLLQNGWVG